MILEKLNNQPHINNYKLILSIKTNCILNFLGQQEASLERAWVKSVTSGVRGSQAS